MSGQLAPCVFCFNHDVVLVWHILPESSYHAECSNCKATGPICPTGDEAVERWNAAWEMLKHYITQVGRWNEKSQRTVGRRRG